MSQLDQGSPSRSIGQLAERSLHAALKEYLAQPGDQFEVKLGRYVIDIVRGDLLIEIQTRHLYALRPKLRRLLDDGHPIRLVHPLPAERWIVREARDGRQTRRKSPKRAAVRDIFKELVRIPDLATTQPDYRGVAGARGTTLARRRPGQLAAQPLEPDRPAAAGR